MPEPLHHAPLRGLSATVRFGRGAALVMGMAFASLVNPLLLVKAKALGAGLGLDESGKACALSV